MKREQERECTTRHLRFFLLIQPKDGLSAFGASLSVSDEISICPDPFVLVDAVEGLSLSLWRKYWTGRRGFDLP